MRKTFFRNYFKIKKRFKETERENLFVSLGAREK